MGFQVPVASTRTSAAAMGPETTERALQQLEEEWRLRLEAPITQLADFEATLNRAIDRMHASLPLPR